MSEEQEKPKRKWNKNWPGVLFVLFLVCVIAFVIVLSAGGEFGHESPNAYPTAREQIQNAVADYSETHNKSLPILNGTYTNANCSNCHVVNMSALLASNGGMLRSMPSGVYASVTDGNDNCGGNTSLGCQSGWSYIWIVNANGDVYSYCVGKGCTSNNSSYQGVWP